ARPPSAGYQVGKFVRRNRLMVSAAAAVFAVLLIGGAASTWEAIRATRAEREESRLRESAQQASRLEQRLRTLAESEKQRAEDEKAGALQSAYAASMLLAQTDWDNNNIAHVRQILNETWDYPDRGFEWYYWQRQAHQELKTLSGHLGVVTGVA